MSDVGISIPFPLVLILVGAMYWPVTVALGFVAVIAAILLRGIGRYACALVGGLLIADACLALWVAG
jgi:hypothetical protein